jgi:ribosomal protein S18 acetylase RimI-like enzyme
VKLVTVGDSVRARVSPWPYDPDVEHLVLLDHHMVPTADDVQRWVARTTQSPTQSVRAIRTGAVFPDAARAFLSAGFEIIDELALLERPILRPRPRVRGSGTQRMRMSQIGDIARLDRAAFGDPWGNDAQSLTDITKATARHRSRIVTLDSGIDTITESGNIGAFAITGQSGAFGYLQRLAVHPAARRRGFAQRLVTDSLSWMQRKGATTAMVNTALDNDAALALYAGFGFTRRRETLSILELSPIS